MKIAVVAREARRDLDAYTLWLRDEADPESAERFARAAIDTFHSFAQAPHIGPAVVSARPDLSDLRKWRVNGFPKVLFFYRPNADGIEVIRVLHAAQDWWAHLDTD